MVAFFVYHPKHYPRRLTIKTNQRGSIAFSTEYAQSHPGFTPPFMQVEELTIDMKAVRDLTKVYRQVDQLCRSLNDTVMQSGSEAFAEALAYYQAVKQAAKMGRPNAKAVYEDLKKRFER